RILALRGRLDAVQRSRDIVHDLAVGTRHDLEDHGDVLVLDLRGSGGDELRQGLTTTLTDALHVDDDAGVLPTLGLALEGVPGDLLDRVEGGEARTDEEPEPLTG